MGQASGLVDNVMVFEWNGKELDFQSEYHP